MGENEVVLNAINQIRLYWQKILLQPAALHTKIIKEVAKELGFQYCGIAKAVKLEKDAARLETWLSKGMHGSMQYMEKYFEQRINPALLVPGAKSVITFLLNYFPAETQNTEKITTK